MELRRISFVVKISKFSPMIVPSLMASGCREPVSSERVESDSPFFIALFTIAIKASQSHPGAQLIALCGVEKNGVSKAVFLHS